MRSLKLLKLYHKVKKGRIKDKSGARSFLFSIITEAEFYLQLVEKEGHKEILRWEIGLAERTLEMLGGCHGG